MSTTSVGKGDATVTSDAADLKCAACGKIGDGLKKCTACKSVKYCNVPCQKRHRKVHKKECKRFETEVALDAAVAAALDAREECPICTLPLPIDENETKNQFCCGKRICHGCFAGSTKQHIDLGKNISNSEALICPFCRTQMASSLQAGLVQVQNGAKRNDPYAIHYLALSYLEGNDGFPKDERKALELFQLASELGNTISIGRMAECHREGFCGLERDKKKMRKYLEKGASLGCSTARFNLGIDEAMKKESITSVVTFHFRISASLGNTEALEKVKFGYKEGFVRKDEFVKTLRAYQQAHDDARSELRDRFVVAREQAEGSD